MLDILNSYTTISLDEMKSVRLMNRIDTKYVTTMPMLVKLLNIAKEEYMVQSIDGQLNMPYYTLYFETSNAHMYMEHLHGRKRRQKIRIRKYVHSSVAFLEIKNKNNRKTERLTIDTNLRFHNLKSGGVCAVEGLVIIEHKRDGNVFSPISAMLNQLRIFPAKFSKYCMGMALTDSSLKSNRFKPRLRMVRKICNVNNKINF